MLPSPNLLSIGIFYFYQYSIILQSKNDEIFVQYGCHEMNVILTFGDDD